MVDAGVIWEASQRLADILSEINNDRVKTTTDVVQKLKNDPTCDTDSPFKQWAEQAIYKLKAATNFGVVETTISLDQNSQLF